MSDSIHAETIKGAPSQTRSSHTGAQSRRSIPFVSTDQAFSMSRRSA